MQEQRGVRSVNDPTGVLTGIEGRLRRCVFDANKKPTAG